MSIINYFPTFGPIYYLGSKFTLTSANSQLKRVLYTTLRILARENGRKEEVCVYVCLDGVRSGTLDF